MWIDLVCFIHMLQGLVPYDIQLHLPELFHFSFYFFMEKYSDYRLREIE